MKRNKNRTEDSHRLLERRVGILNETLQEVANEVRERERERGMTLRLHKGCPTPSCGELCRKMAHHSPRPVVEQLVGSPAELPPLPSMAFTAVGSSTVVLQPQGLLPWIPGVHDIRLTVSHSEYST